jgi:uncharacterized protein YhaN
VKNFLSNEAVLNKILGKINKVILKASISNGRVSGNNVGEIGKRSKIEVERARLVDLFDEVTNNISWGHYNKLSSDAIKFQKKLDQQIKAKKHKAYKLFSEICTLKKEFDSFDLNNLSQLIEKKAEHKRNSITIEQLESDFEEAKNKSANYTWLDIALGDYDGLTKLGKDGIDQEQKWKKVVLIIGLFFVLSASILFFLISIKIIPAILIAIGIISIILGSRIFEKGPDSDVKAIIREDKEELRKLKEDFLSRTGKELISKSSITEKLKQEAEHFHLKPKLEEDLKKAKRDSLVLKSEINSMLDGFELKGSESRWDRFCADLESRKKELDDIIREKERDLSSLNIEKEDYLKSFKGEGYSNVKIKTLQENINQIEELIQEEDKSLLGIKSKAITILSLVEPLTWEEILSELQTQIKKIEDDHKEIQSDIISDFVLGKSIEGIKSDEDKKIKDALASKDIINPIEYVTDKYKSISLDGDEIIVHSDMEDVLMSELSTGAREQVLLGIRIGLITNLFGQKQGFLILDDAFQHSDYTRRERSVDMIFDLAKNNWQVIYFSMDDHIAALFDKRGKKFGKEYQRINI